MSHVLAFVLTPEKHSLTTKNSDYIKKQLSTLFTHIVVLHITATVTNKMLRYRRDHRVMCSKFRYLSKFTTALRGFHCDSNAFELNNNINHVKITVLNTSIYCL